MWDDVRVYRRHWNDFIKMDPRVHQMIFKDVLNSNSELSLFFWLTHEWDDLLTELRIAFLRSSAEDSATYKYSRTLAWYAVIFLYHDIHTLYWIFDSSREVHERFRYWRKQKYLTEPSMDTAGDVTGDLFVLSEYIIFIKKGSYVNSVWRYHRSSHDR